MQYYIATLLLLLPLACVVAFARWIALRPSDFALDQKIKNWDAFVKLLSAMTIVVAGVFTLLKYFDQRGNELDQQQLEFIREQFNKKSETYGEAIKYASAIASADSLENEQTSEAIAKFDQLYWGNMQ